MMNGYLLLVLELAAILLVCVLLAFLIGRASGKRVARASAAKAVAAAPPAAVSPGMARPVLPELHEPPSRPRAPGLVDPAEDSATLPPSLEQTRPVVREPEAAEASEETVTRASLQEGQPTGVPDGDADLSAAQLRISELEEQLRKQEIEMSWLETGATTAWDTTMPQLLGRIEGLEKELQQARDESRQLQNLLEIERGRAADEGWPSTPSE